MPEPAAARPAPNRETGPAAAPQPGLDSPPVLAIVRGNPSAEEIGAIVAVLAARAATARATRARGPVRSEWSSRSRLLRAPLPRGPGGWRASALPR